MKKIVYFGLLFILFSFSELKSDSSTHQDSLGNHLWYIEMSGKNIFLASFNYEYIFAKNEFLFDDVSLKAGIGGLFIVAFLRFEFPVTINFIIGKKHCFETGIGVSFDYVPESFKYEYPSQVVKFRGSIGYRFINDKGLIFRADIIPIYFAGSGLNVFYGISFGHYF
ncbi:MAG: hypothetical protein A2X61_03040 [Ignavibacteria bacterium GWB2_35_12]|nr:MAG: hypothetical protein A2X63_11510 [Ignavibacteria bacterium GWA2_35_8]OGU38267.1 MAG: hypothetical protein A2X61_03040 [Ignavibacteria bacterium GWB2_35_12]OGU95488.1 MAG: hypothetical protein A2220_07215 [Ignavibacteria bacterium RIFOXYA2_FULL_35_10]OGV20795.1 MAG: hypothetical protein A2475_11505 [Ignavibacteria bacterium RIFOXYC2_FULL_35_21]